MRSLRLPLILLALLVALAALAVPPKGQRVLTAGHSFCVPVQPALALVAKAAGITDHVNVDTQFIGNSTVTQQWELPDDQNIAKRDLREGKADVLILSPNTKIPDDAIDCFTHLMLANNPKGRVLIYEPWLPFDGKPPVDNAHRADLHRDTRTMAELLRLHQPFCTALAAQVRALNKEHGHQVVFTVPVGLALITLRGMVAAGKVPGITSQDALFADAMGHPSREVAMLGAYCEYAVIYRRSPVGIPVPAGVPLDPKLNKQLEQIAWDAVTFDPLTGVKATPEKK